MATSTPDKAFYIASIDGEAYQFEDRDGAYEFWCEHPHSLVFEAYPDEGKSRYIHGDFEDWREESRVDFALTRSHERSFARPSGY